MPENSAEASQNAIHIAKQELRRKISARIKGMTPDARATADADLISAIKRYPLMQNAPQVLAYYPLRDEIDIRPLLNWIIAQGKTLVLPRVSGERTMSLHIVKDLTADLTSGELVSGEPKADLPQATLNADDLIIVPGRAFTRAGDRLGRGKGYYDSLLTNCPAQTIALAYNEQIVDAIPTDAHDQPIPNIITP